PFPDRLPGGAAVAGIFATRAIIFLGGPCLTTSRSNDLEGMSASRQTLTSSGMLLSVSDSVIDERDFPSRHVLVRIACERCPSDWRRHRLRVGRAGLCSRRVWSYAWARSSSMMFCSAAMTSSRSTRLFENRSCNLKALVGAL